jgi:hypothetical protein
MEPERKRKYQSRLKEAVTVGLVCVVLVGLVTLLGLDYRGTCSDIQSGQLYPCPYPTYVFLQFLRFAPVLVILGICLVGTLVLLRLPKTETKSESTTTLAAETKAEDMPRSGTIPTAKKRSLRWLWIGLAIVVLGIGAFVTFTVLDTSGYRGTCLGAMGGARHPCSLEEYRQHNITAWLLILIILSPVILIIGALVVAFAILKL